MREQRVSCQKMDVYENVSIQHTDYHYTSKTTNVTKCLNFTSQQMHSFLWCSILCTLTEFHLCPSTKPHSRLLLLELKMMVNRTRMWANAQRDGRPAAYRGPLSVQFHKVWLTPTTTEPCSDAAKTQNLLKLAGVPQICQQISAVSGPSSPYCGDMWKRYCCLTSFFPIVNTCLSCEDIARQSCAMVRIWRIFGDFLRPAVPVSLVQHVSDLYPTMCLRRLRIGQKKKEEDR